MKRDVLFLALLGTAALIVGLAVGLWVSTLTSVTHSDTITLKIPSGGETTTITVP